MLNRFKRTKRLLALGSVVSYLVIGTASCGNRDSEAVRLIVIAELIQRERTPESQISVVSVHFPNGETAIVEATILQPATKASAPERKVLCRLERKEGRWSLVSVDDEKLTPSMTPDSNGA